MMKEDETEGFLCVVPGGSEGGRDGRAQPAVPEREGHVLPHAAAEPGPHPRHAGLRHRAAVLRAAVRLVRCLLPIPFIELSDSAKILIASYIPGTL